MTEKQVRLVSATATAWMTFCCVAGFGQGSEAGAGKQSSTAEFWAINPLKAVYEGRDMPGTNDLECAVKLAGARGGGFSGQIVLCSAASAKGPEAKVSDLKSKSGAIIPASAVEIRYALPTGANGGARLPKGQTIFDALDTSPREQGTVHPVWVTVNIPTEAQAEEYEGKLSVGGRDIPVRLTVADWTLPKPQDYLTWVDFIESPESVALRYEAPLWSDRHFELLATVFRQLGKVGNKTLYLPLAGKVNLGQEFTIVRWIKTDKPKEFKHDFVPVERYLDACITNAGKPAFVICHLYEDFYGGCMGWPPEKPSHRRGVQVTLLDPETGKTEIMEGPGWCRSNTNWTEYPQDTVNFWKPVLDGIRERMKARGLGDENLAAGLSRDMVPLKQTPERLLEIAPGIRWVHHGHGAQMGLHKIMQGAICTTVWNARFPKDPSVERTHGWQNKSAILHNDRDIWKPDFQRQLVRGRLLGELNIAGKQRGFGRMSADFWPCLKNPKGQLYGIASRWPESNWSQLNLNQTPYLYPGTNGALSTIRFEMLREGVQECEARIFIDKALVDPASRAKLGEELAKKCQDLLDERVRALLDSMSKKGKAGDGLQESTADFADSPWQERSGKLYAAAGEVSKVLGAK